MKSIDVRYNKRCAFCKYWYDPSNSAIKPVNPKNHSWEYDEIKSMYLSGFTSTEISKKFNSSSLS